MGGFNDPYTELSNGYFSHNEERESKIARSGIIYLVTFIMEPTGREMTLLLILNDDQDLL